MGYNNVVLEMRWPTFSFVLSKRADLVLIYSYNFNSFIDQYVLPQTLTIFKVEPLTLNISLHVVNNVVLKCYDRFGGA